MNRILIGSGNNEIQTINNDKVIIDIKKDVNVLIENDDFNKYVFNVYSSSVNVFCKSEYKDNATYEININKGYVSFNNLSYSSNDVQIDVNLNKENSSVSICNSVIAKHDVTHKIKIMHNCKNTYSKVNNNGITKEDGSIFFDVLSLAPKKCKNCKIYQDSKIISFNDTNKNQINPVLLIDEYDVEAKHSAFIGNFNFNDLFYLMSRGLNKKQAKELLTKGLLIGTLDLCFDEKEMLKKKLDDDWR